MCVVAVSYLATKDDERTLLGSGPTYAAFVLKLR